MLARLVHCFAGAGLLSPLVCSLLILGNISAVRSEYDAFAEPSQGPSIVAVDASPRCNGPSYTSPSKGDVITIAITRYCSGRQRDMTARHACRQLVPHREMPHDAAPSGLEICLCDRPPWVYTHGCYASPLAGLTLRSAEMLLGFKIVDHPGQFGVRGPGQNQQQGMEKPRHAAITLTAWQPRR